MKYAIVNNTKEEASKGIKGVCPSCGSEVIAKCGEQKISHWAHKATRTCDPWWEPETEWHRSWKDKYPTEWQEIILFDEKTLEKHIADTRTIHNLVIEFQHSNITPEERTAREKFYWNMVWVVDGTRLKRDYSRFEKGMEGSRRTNHPNAFIVYFPDEVFPVNWISSSVPVVFDFYEPSVAEQQEEIRNVLWVLLPSTTQSLQAANTRILVRMSRQDFITITHNRGKLFPEKTMETPKAPPQTQHPIQIPVTQPTHNLHRGRWVRRRRF